eukprot:TRINITY_DN765_c0_g1_i2.p1 TRINITY_DN765_c0_g1~~TRINITY_DN765_c0_g1_i2.p1  ORF type:complete len:733 (-),score=247.38 TRINITY_DN765_c0_g1_i2:175-2373(-)
MGNRAANDFWEAKFAKPEIKPTATTDKQLRAAFLQLKYVAMEFVDLKCGYVNMKPLQQKKQLPDLQKLTLKKQSDYKKYYISITQSAIEIYKEKGDRLPHEIVNLLAHTIKEAPKTEKDYLNTFHLITPKTSYVCNVATPEEVSQWMYHIKIATRRLLNPIDDKLRQSCIKLLQSQMSSQLSTPSAPVPSISSSTSLNSTREMNASSSPQTSSALTSSGTDVSDDKASNVQIDAKMLFELIDQRSEDRKVEILELNGKLVTINENLEKQAGTLDSLRQQLKEMEKKQSELREEQQKVKRRLNQLQLPELNTSVKAPQDEGLDATSNSLVLNEDGSIKGGTVQKLVEMLTHEQYMDPDYLTAFLLTYRSFTTSSDVMEKLVLRYQITPPPFASNDDLKKFKEQIQRPIHLRIMNVIKNWITSYYFDFEGDPTLLKTLLQFIDDYMEPTMKVSADQLRKLIHKKLKAENKSQEVMLDPSRIPEPILPRDLSNFQFEDLDPQEVARQLTLLEESLYRAIRPQECLNQAWNKQNKEMAAPNILAAIRRFNKVSSWVSYSVCRYENIHRRLWSLERFITIAKHLRELHNYNAVQEILSGLHSSATHRLKKTWDAVNKKLKKEFALLEKLMANDNNYASFRSALHSESPPCIPYLGMYLTDLTFIEDGTPDRLQGGLINFSKRRRVAGVIREIQQYQQTPYALKPIPAILTFLDNIEGADEKLCYDLSLYAEPRETSE